jgi:hypothetical protein
MQPVLSPQDPALARVRAVAILILALGFAAYVGLTWHWPLTGDTQVMHYVTFLTDHGFAPYREIGDMNMPGAYLADRWALSLFGHSDFGWRLYDFALSILLGVGMVWIARSYDWLAGLTAAVLFALTHGADGPPDAGQRDQVIAVLLVLACAALFESVRSRRVGWMCAFGFLSALAASIKPTFLPFAPLLFACAALELMRHRVALKAYAAAAIAGFAAASLIVLAYLFQHHAAQPFYLLLTQTLPHYQALGALSWGTILAHNLPLSVALFATFGLIAACFVRPTLPAWEMTALLLAAAIGELSYLFQHKGFQQHRYMLLAFLLLWASIHLWAALSRTGTTRIAAIAALLACAVYILPVDLSRVRSYPVRDAYTESLESDLTQLGVPRLQNNVQCFDIIDGCLTALFHLDIVQSTGATGDLLLFQPIPAPQVDHAREVYSRWAALHPPDVYVVSNLYFGQPQRSFDRLLTWPDFAAALNAKYTLAKQREFGAQPTSNPGTNPNVPAYRIYIRKDSPLAAVPLH